MVNCTITEDVQAPPPTWAPSERLEMLTIYGHLGEIRHRAGVVEFRVEQHAVMLGERLAEMRGNLR